MSLRSVRWRKIGGLGFSLAVLALSCLQSSGQTSRKKPVATGPSFGADVRPLIVKNCIGCHGGKEPAAGLNLTLFATPDSVLNDTGTWTKVLDRISTSQMPPAGMAQPDAGLKKRTIAWIQLALKNQCRLADPGRVTIRRLNREEYNNTIRDLTGLNLHPADDFPSDDVGYGFDNIGDVLSISPLLMEKYLSAAEQVARSLIQVPDVRTRHFEASEMSNGPFSATEDSGWREFYSSGESTQAVNLPAGGRYRLKVVAAAELAGPDLPHMVVTMDGKQAAAFEVGTKRPATTAYEAPINVDAGKHTVGISFTNDYYNPADPKGKQDRNLWVNHFELIGPLDAKPPLTPAYLHLVPNQPSPDRIEKDARKYLTAFAEKAYRRPLTVDEQDRLMKLFEAGRKSGGNFDSGMQIGVEGILVSPSFLFRVELDPVVQAGQVRSLTDFELASRLSYFLWSSLPDDELLDLARQGKLHKDAVLNAQVKRMLADSKAKALSDNFAGQWLQLKKLAIIEPDPQRFPGIDEAMKKNMATETKMFFRSVLTNNQPITDFIDSDYTFVNEPLAKLYGMPGITGDNFQKVAVTEPRGGVLTQASVLTVTSNPTRTSPTKRGKWVLEQILGTPPPPPPPGVGVIDDERHKVNGASLRQLMEQHRKNPSCAACHAKMDPIGFGMESFDAVGRWRTKDGDFDLDTTGILPDGRSFKGATDLKKILLGNKENFARALTEKLLTYGLGRGIESADKCAVDGIVKQSAANGYRFESLLISVVDSDPFRKRKGERTK